MRGELFDSRRPQRRVAVSSNPPDFSNLMLWLDWTDTSTMFTDLDGLVPATGPTDLLRRTNDKSGNNRHAVQTVDATRPQRSTSGGKATMYCDGTGKGLVVPSTALAACGSAFTIYIVALRDSGVSGGDYLTFIDGGRSGPYRDCALYFPNSYGGIFGSGGGDTLPADLTATSFGVVMLRGTRTVSRHARRNAGTEHSLSASFASTAVLSESLGIGTNRTGGTNGWKGHYLAALLYRADHVATQADVRSWVDTKYGVS